MMPFNMIKIDNFYPKISHLLDRFISECGIGHCYFIVVIIKKKEKGKKKMKRYLFIYKYRYNKYDNSFLINIPNFVILYNYSINS